VRVVAHADAQSLWASAEALLSSDVANNTHQLSAIKRLIDVGAHHGQQCFSIHQLDDADAANDIVGSAVIVDTRTLFLSVMPDAAAACFATYCNDHALNISGVFGQVQVVDVFEATYQRESTVHVHLMLYQLMSAPQFGRATGRSRIATRDDTALLVEWHHAFEQETGSLPLPTAMIERVQRRIDERQLIVWIDSDEIVAFAGVNALPAASARIGPVYTPPAMRSRGYAQAVTAAAGEHVQRVDAIHAESTLFLFTDAHLPASNKAYQRIGYVHIADHIHRSYIAPH
jgi:predicted GNAT family acetyltransferase